MPHSVSELSLVEKSSLTERLKAKGRELGFDLIGVAPAVTPPGFPDFLDWLNHRCAAGMEYLPRTAEARGDPNSVLAGVHSIVMVAFSYKPPEPDTTSSDPSRAPRDPDRIGKIARYAKGRDYHKVLWKRLGRLLDWVQAEVPGCSGRAVADTAPLLERDYARLAGLGWIAKNTMLINKKLGSYTVLGALLTDLELEPDTPHQSSHCGTCTRCLDACPTDAFDGPGRLDANRCISYWTIEHRGSIPEPYAQQLQGWLFGCDICQEVCPWNRKAPAATEPDLLPNPARNDPDLIELLTARDEQLATLLRGSALNRTKRSGILRNAALILGSRRHPDAIAPLTSLLQDHDPDVRDAAAQALEQIVRSSD